MDLNSATDELTEINLDDLVSSFGLQDNPLLKRITRKAFRRPAFTFAEMMRRFDTLSESHSLAFGARATLDCFIHSLQVTGENNLQASGPVLYLSNHPGMVDTLALFATIKRADLKIIALQRPFLQSLPGISKRLLYVSQDSNLRMQSVRQATNHLRAGGAVLTFPAGKIEPDPKVYPGAIESLEEWTETAGVFLRLVPGLKIIPIMVSGVLWEKAVKFPLVRIKANREEREKFGAGLQLLSHILFNAHPLNVEVRISEPIQPVQTKTHDLSAVHSLICESMRNLYLKAGIK